MKKLLFALIGLMFLISCQESDTTELVKVKNQYSVELPSFLIISSELNDDASLQYQNLYKEFYVIVIDETKQELIDVITENGLDTSTFKVDFDMFTSFVKEDFIYSIEIDEIPELKDTTINNLNAKLLELDGSFDGIEIFYDIAYVEGKDSYYQIMVWTLGENKEDYKAKMNKIIASFKEI